MPKGDKSAHTEQQGRRVGSNQKGAELKGVPRAEAEAHARATAKQHGGGKKMGSGRKVPFGPVGGLGRKTNLARSS